MMYNVRLYISGYKDVWTNDIDAEKEQKVMYAKLEKEGLLYPSVEIDEVLETEKDRDFDYIEED